jgi:hypothetical protein
MDRALLALFLGHPGVSEALAGDMTLDVERGCRSISESDLHGCTCLGGYFVTKFGPDESAALHLVERSFVSKPRISAAALSARFGADMLNRVAWKILETQDQAVSSCP